jgi:hypothetical protein
LAGVGGYQPPANPAMVSGPGALSQRTDGSPTQPIRALPNAQYGANKEFVQLQQAAPLPSDAGPGGPPQAGAPAGPQMPSPVPLTAGTVMPDQPVTHGADAGPGADSSILGGGSPVVAQYQNAKDMVSQLASSPNASPALRQLAAAIGQTY